MHELEEQETLVPPVTGGIAPQPPKAELESIAQKFSARTQPNRVVVIIALVALLLLGGGVMAFFVFQKPVNMLEEDQQVDMIEVPISGETEPDTADIEVERFLADEIFTGDFITIFADIAHRETSDLQWQDRGLEYTLQSIYDLGVLNTETVHSLRVPEPYLGSRVIVTALSVYDTRITGSQIPISAFDYVALRHEQTDVSAAEWREQLSSPQETQTVYVPFILDPAVGEYFVLVGDLLNPLVASMSAQATLSQDISIP